jgi:hypothetical protein
VGSKVKVPISNIRSEVMSESTTRGCFPCENIVPLRAALASGR